MRNSNSGSFQEQLDREIARLREHAATSVDPCTVAKVIALSDKAVVEIFLRKLDNRDIYRGVRCIGIGRVLFEFDCPQGQICLVAPSFLARVDIPHRKVIAIVDPFDPINGVEAVQPASTGTLTLSAVKHGTTTTEASRHTVTITITGVADKAAKIDAQSLTFSGDVAQADVGVGTHTCQWAVRGDPGDPFTIKLEGPSHTISFSAQIQNPAGEAGQFDFTIA